MIGKLNMYVEPGTIMGPTINKELVTAHLIMPRAEGYEGPDATTFRHTQTKDFSAVPASGPRSVTEHSMMAVTQTIFGPARMSSPYEMPTPKAMPAKLIVGEGQNGR